MVTTRRYPGHANAPRRRGVLTTVFRPFLGHLCSFGLKPCDSSIRQARVSGAKGVRSSSTPWRLSILAAARAEGQQCTSSSVRNSRGSHCRCCMEASGRPSGVMESGREGHFTAGVCATGAAQERRKEKITNQRDSPPSERREALFQHQTPLLDLHHPQGSEHSCTFYTFAPSYLCTSYPPLTPILPLWCLPGKPSHTSETQTFTLSFSLSFHPFGPRLEG